jgi:branched-chain amino acid transport system permease protein
MNWLHIIFMCEIYMILSLSANLVSGYTGLLSFANAAFYGLGAYVTTLVMKNFGFNYFPSLLIAVGFNVLVSFIITYFSIRLKDLYFTLATLAFQVIVFSVLYNWEKVTGGSYGISEISAVNIFGHQLNGTKEYAMLGGCFALIVISFFYFFQRTPFVRLLECIRDRELGAVSLGKNISYYKFICNSVAAAFIAIAGSLFAVYNSYIDATSFTLNESILIVNMILIGGTGNLIGPIFGACFYVILPELTRLIPIDSTQGASLQMIIYSLILILVVRFKPNGLFGKFKFQ